MGESAYGGLSYQQRLSLLISCGLDWRGTAIDNRGTAIDNNGTAIDNNGTAIDNRGTAIDNRGTAIDNNGGRSIIVAPQAHSSVGASIQGCERWYDRTILFDK